MTALFASHPRLWAGNAYVYPVVSRRSRGLSLGVNLNPDKVCNFDCVYCSVDRNVEPTVRHVDLAVVARELEAILDPAASGTLFAAPPFDQTPAALRRLNDVAFSGDGEPTAYPQFAAALDLAVRALDARGLSQVKVVVITNATLFDRPAVADALVALDRRASEVWAKLDAGTDEHFARVDRSRFPLDRICANLLALGRRRPLVIQSLFLRVAGVPPSSVEIVAYLDRLRDLRSGGCRISRVQVYTTARPTAENTCAPLTRTEVDAIAAGVRALGIEAEAFYAPE